MTSLTEMFQPPAGPEGPQPLGGLPMGYMQQPGDYSPTPGYGTAGLGANASAPLEALFLSSAMRGVPQPPMGAPMAQMPAAPGTPDYFENAMQGPRQLGLNTYGW